MYVFFRKMAEYQMANNKTQFVVSILVSIITPLQALTHGLIQLVSLYINEPFCRYVMWSADISYKTNQPTKEARGFPNRKLSVKNVKSGTILARLHMILRVTPDAKWKRIFRLSYEEFYGLLVDELRHYIPPDQTTQN